METQERFFRLDFEGSQANVKIKTLPEVWNSFLYPKPRARTSIGQKPIQIFQKAFKSQETCTRFKANTENHQPDDFCTVLGRWEDRTKRRELQLSWKAWLKAVTVQGKHLWVLRPFSNHTVDCMWSQTNLLKVSICSQALLNESQGKPFFTSFRKGWSFAMFAQYLVKHCLSIIYIFHWYHFTKDLGWGGLNTCNLLKHDEM